MNALANENLFPLLFIELVCRRNLVVVIIFDLIIIIYIIIDLTYSG